MYYKKPYETGFIIGRFQTFTKGHEKLVETGLQLCDKVLLVIGSAQEYRTARNPFSISIRTEMINKIYGVGNPNLQIAYLNDLTDENDISHKWGSYLMNNVKEILGCKPDVMIYGNDESRSDWFDKKELENITEIIVNRNSEDCPISATYLRTLMVRDNYEEWAKWTNKKIHEMYRKLRNELLEIPYYKNILKQKQMTKTDQLTALEIDRLTILLRNAIETFRECNSLLYDESFKKSLIRNIGITEEELIKYEIYNGDEE